MSAGLPMLRPKLVAFARVMERKLRENDHKGGWEDEDIEWLMERLTGEVAELSKALTTPNDGPLSERRRRSAVREAADVANFAMMVADVLGGLR